jgi:hypothetical protein
VYFEFPIQTNGAVTPPSADNETWRATETRDPHEHPTKTPGSGLYFGFFVQKFNQRVTTGFKNDPSFNNYTREQLAQLSKEGLQFLLHDPSSVDKGIAQTASKEPQPQLVCFPWAIFEAHRWHGIFEFPETDGSFASDASRVSATASIALSMFERLAKFADEKHEGQHIPPVIAITVAEANTTVWLAYCDIVDDKLRDHVRALRCSWT